MRPPRYQTPLVGRRDELRALRDALRPGSLVTLLGPGGVGKTRLASEGVGDAPFLDLTSARTASDAAQAVLQAVGSRQPATADEDALHRAAAALAEVPGEVVVLDNLEQLADAARVVSALRAARPGRSFVVTSRVALGLPDEVRVAVAPFAPGGDDAVDLFLRVLGPGAPHHERRRIAALAAALDGLPLALELAAGRATVLPLDELERRLGDPLRLLADPSRPHDKGSALWRSVSWSVDLLAPPARRTLAWCAVFAGPFDRAMTLAIAGTDADLDAAVRLHLLREDAGRVRPYEVVARFAERLLEASGERAEAELAHARWCWSRSEAVTPGEGMWQVHAEVGVEVDAALGRAEHPDASVELREVGQRLAARWHLVHQARWPREVFVERAARVAPRVESRLSALIAIRRAGALTDLQRHDDAEPLLEESVAWTRANGQADLLAMALSYLAGDAANRDQLHRIEPLCREGIEVARAAGLRHLEVEFLFGSINVPLAMGGRFAEILDNLARVRSSGVEVPWIEADLRIREASARVELGERAGALAPLAALEPSRLMPLVELARRTVIAKVHLVSDASPLAAVAELVRDPPMPIDGQELDTLSLVARALDGELTAAELDACLRASPTGRSRALALRALTLDAAGVVVGRLPDQAMDRRDPVLAAVSEAVALLRAELAGELSPDEARIRLDTLRPVCWELALARRLLDRRAELRRRPQIGPDGAWVVLDGRRREVTGAAQRRLLAVLAAHADARGDGLSVDALFAAGWPGERVRPASAANRVRVALTALRGAGVPIAFARGRGWSIEG